MNFDSIINALGRAADLVDQGTELFNTVKPSIDSITGERPKELDEAKARFERSIARAQEAGANLNAAIDARLGDRQ